MMIIIKSHFLAYLFPPFYVNPNCFIIYNGNFSTLCTLKYHSYFYNDRRLTCGAFHICCDWYKKIRVNRPKNQLKLFTVDVKQVQHGTNRFQDEDIAEIYLNRFK